VTSIGADPNALDRARAPDYPVHGVSHAIMNSIDRGTTRTRDHSSDRSSASWPRIRTIQ
jgi:hypothetical protein